MFRLLITFALVVSMPASCSFIEDTGTSTLDLKITDGPVDIASNVWIKFESVELKPEGRDAQVIEIDKDAIDLLSLPGSVSEYLLEGIEIDAGDYEWIKLNIDASESYIHFQGVGELIRFDLPIASGFEDGLTIADGFSVEGGSKTSLTIDFDLRKSIISNAEQTEYQLKPSLRMVEDSNAGHIRGTVSGSFIADTDCVDKGVVYAFRDGDELTDISATGGPVASSVVGIGALYTTFEIGFLPTGSYVVAHTCDASIDDPEIDGDTVEFSSGLVVVVKGGGEVATANFE